MIIRIGFWGLFYFNYNKDPPKIVQVLIQAPVWFLVVAVAHVQDAGIALIQALGRPAASHLGDVWHRSPASPRSRFRV